jgi:hypothetical protein
MGINKTTEIINPDTFVWGCGNVLFFYVLFSLKFLKCLYFFAFVAPRGLLQSYYLGIAPEHRIPLVNKSLIIQVILMTAIIMMLNDNS